MIALLIPGACAPDPWRGIDVDPLEISVIPASNDSRTDPALNFSNNAWQGRVSAVGRRLPDLPATTLHLPAVSPDGRWIAFLEDDPDHPPVTPQAAITGNGLQHVRLRLRPLEAEGAGDIIATAAAWPTWSADGSTLAFITYDGQGVAYVGRHDPDRGTTQLTAVGLQRMMMPRLSPDGRTAAVVSYSQAPSQARFFLIDLDTKQATPGPRSQAGAQLLPHWAGNDGLLFIELATEEPAIKPATLRAWQRGRNTSTTLAEIVAPDNIFDAHMLLAGVQTPLRPGGGAFALFEPAMGQVTLINLANGDRLPTLPSSVAGAWYGRDWFVTAGPQDIRMLHLPEPLAIDDRERLHGVRLFDGRWAPLLADPDGQGAILLGLSDDPTRRRLMQLWLRVTAD